jgi:hypothetical protein
VNTVARAHDMILGARRPAYRPRALAREVEVGRTLFEGWTHDASILPITLWPLWRLKFERDAKRLMDRWAEWRRAGFAEKFDEVLTRIAQHGPVTSAEVGEGEARGSGGWWDWHPSKTALEYLWRSGRLAVSRREGFRKVYDLAENVIPPEMLNTRLPEDRIVARACEMAMDRLGLATSGEIAAFWDLVTPEEAKGWVADECAAGRLLPVRFPQADGRWRKLFARPDVRERIAALPEAPARMRVLSPFDPALRDRNRAERLWGFHYRIEIFVPEAQRIYGYYVFPLLEGDRLVGRIDARADRQSGCLAVRALWPERGVRWGKARQARLEAALTRLARLGRCDRVTWADGWLHKAR